MKRHNLHRFYTETPTHTHHVSKKKDYLDIVIVSEDLKDSLKTIRTIKPEEYLNIDKKSDHHPVLFELELDPDAF